jgi:glycosyltransferase involved in cell wall biosynthesis
MSKAVIISKVEKESNGGIESFQKNLNNILSDNGYSVEVIEPKKKSKTLTRVTGIYVLRHLKKLMKSDLVLINDPQISIAAIASFINPFSRKILFSHGWIFHNEKNKIISILFKLWVNTIANCVAKVVCVSEQDEKIIWNKSKTIVLHNPVKLRTPKKKMPGAVLIVSRDAKNKNLPLMAELLKELVDENLISKVFLVGAGLHKYFPANEFYDFHCGITEEKLDDLYGASTFFMSLSSYEGFGIALIEAMSAGCIPIVSDIPPYRAHGVISRLVSLDYDRSEMLTTIRKIIEEDEGSLEDYAEKYSIEAYEQKIKKVIGRA